MMLKIGVLGVGHLGKIHLNCIKNIDDYELAGFYDPDVGKVKEAKEEYGLRSFDSIESLIETVDVVDIVTPTISHFTCAAKAIKKSRHVFIEKPIAATADEARQLIELTAEANVKIQVGHVERFNPAFTAAAGAINKPMFMECHRLAQFNPRGTDVPVVLDLMIHDIDIILSVVKSNIRKVHASGVNVVSDTPDIANARLEFDNGAVANLTASRISLKNMRKTRFFQKDAYITVDFLDKVTEIVRMDEITETPKDPFAIILDLGADKVKKRIFFDKPEIKPVNAIEEELRSLARAIQNNTATRVTINDGFRALELAQMIVDKINASSNNL
ncbi:MAG: Gfo/Idh/MocA family oxidoreductase [Bacteroidales bacterium]|nr:Gfo/Idh/MocA family oxidoreductase [Bacteroidales bacterium]